MKIRILSILLVLIGSYNSSHSQNYSTEYSNALAKEKASRKSKPIKLSPHELLDSATNEFLYFYVRSEPESDIIIDDYYILQVGPKYSLYTQYGQYRMDSLAFSSPNMSWIVDNLEFRRISDENRFYYDYILQDHEKNDSIYVMQSPSLGTYLQYSEEEPSFNWNLTVDTAQVGPYKCKKATTTFRGRDWEAWYAEEIPISGGPWKFRGLPGLILKVKDKESHHVFSLNKIRETKTPIGIIKRGTRKLTREKVNDIMLDRAKNPVAPSLDGKISPLTDINGNPIKPAKQFTNFIERE